MNELKCILQVQKGINPCTIVSEHRTGTTTIVRKAAREVGQGVIYVEISDEREFDKELAKAIGWSLEKKLPFIIVLLQKLLSKALLPGKDYVF